MPIKNRVGPVPLVRPTPRPLLRVCCCCRSGEVLPWVLIEERIRKVQPFEVFMVRSMLSVPYFEKALYELPEDQVRALGSTGAEYRMRCVGVRSSPPDCPSCFAAGWLHLACTVLRVRVQVTPERVLALADEVEREVEGRAAPRCGGGPLDGVSPSVSPKLCSSLMRLLGEKMAVVVWLRGARPPYVVPTTLPLHAPRRLLGRA